MKETQKSITLWANRTFGFPVNMYSMALRALKEMDELVRAAAQDDSKKAAEEIADVFIVLYRFASQLGYDVQELVNQKMIVNRNRDWIVKDGHGQHVDKTCARFPGCGCVNNCGMQEFK